MAKARRKSARRRAESPSSTGKLRIGDMWNAITIIASSQTNPLKAIAEFVENAIDARARHITIVRRKQGGATYLHVIDDGQGVPRDPEGRPDFKYVATHICDSIKRKMKSEGIMDIQGEFGIGLLSFWTVGETLTLSSTGADGATWEMRMKKGDPGYTVRRRRTLLSTPGTELRVGPLLPGLRMVTGEKIQWYLASELRDRIRAAGVEIRVIDRRARKQFRVEPRQFSGRLMRDLPLVRTEAGEVYLELYLAAHDPQNRVGLYRSGTRVLESITRLDRFDREPWTSGYFEGIVDAPFLHLTPGTRGGVIRDAAFATFADAMEPVEVRLSAMVAEQREAEEERASRRILRAIQSALREALAALPPEEYDWFDIRTGRRRRRAAGDGPKLEEGDVPAEGAAAPAAEAPGGGEAAEKDEEAQRCFFEFAGPLFSVRIQPASCVMPVNAEKTFIAVPRDRQRRRVERDLSFAWRIAGGEGRLLQDTEERVTFLAPPEPGLNRIEVTATQADISCTGETLVTVTDSLTPAPKGAGDAKRGLPGYTYLRAPGELWRSRYDEENNLVVINNGHRDFVFASRKRSRKLRYICRLFAKELVCRNFPGIPPDQLLERMIELSLYTEENLR